MKEMQPDYYAVLELSPHATEREIRTAYRRLALRYHPDRNEAQDAHDKFIRINEAYLILSDAEARARYDAEPSAGSRAGAADSTQWTPHHRDGPSPFDDEELNRWRRNASRQAERYASMNYAAFVDLVGRVAKETASQLTHALVFGLSAFFATSAIIGFFVGLAQGDAAELALAVAVGFVSAGGLMWANAKYKL